MPPGYREYTFHPDGSIESRAVLLDQEPWTERTPLPDAFIAWLMEEISTEELKEQMGL